MAVRQFNPGAVGCQRSPTRWMTTASPPLSGQNPYRWECVSAELVLLLFLSNMALLELEEHADVLCLSECELFRHYHMHETALKQSEGWLV